MPNLKSLLTQPVFQRSCIMIIAAVVMHFTPDYIDEIIKILLVVWGVTDMSTAIKLQG